MTVRIERPTDEIVNAMDIAIRRHPALSLNQHPDGPLATLLQGASSAVLPGITSVRAYFWVTRINDKLVLVIEDVEPDVRNTRGDFVTIVVTRAKFKAAERAALDEICLQHS